MKDDTVTRGAARLTRRTLLVGAAGGTLGLALALAGCSPAPSAPAKPAEQKPAEPAAAQKAPAVAGGEQKPAAPTAPAKPAAEQPQPGGELIVALNQEPLSLDPTNANGISVRPLMVLYDTLVVQSLDGKAHPGLAESWQVAPDGKSYTFKLKKGVKFHDGTPFNAEAVKFNFDRISRADAKATFSISIRGIYEKTEVVDDLTARVILNQPYAPFLDGLAEGYDGMVSPAAVEKYGKDFDRNPVGTGPFSFVEWASKSHVAVKKNPDYAWGSSLYKHQSAPYLDKVTFRLITENSTRTAVLETGEVQVAENVPSGDVARLKKDPKIQILEAPARGASQHLQLNTTKPPLDDEFVRRAINYAVDQSELVKVVYDGVYPIARAPISPGLIGFDESVTKIYSHDPAKAREVLEQGGWKAGPDGARSKDGKPLELTVNVISELVDLVQASELLQAQFREAGIKLNIQKLDTAAWNAANAQQAQQMVIGWRGASDPDFMRQIFHSQFIGKSPLQRTLYKDARLDQLLDQGPNEQDPAKRGAIYKEIQEIIMNKGLIVPFWYQMRLVGARSNVRDVSLDIRGYPVLYDAWIAK